MTRPGVAPEPRDTTRARVAPEGHGTRRPGVAAEPRDITRAGVVCPGPAA
jgi:hypothetical protein